MKKFVLLCCIFFFYGVNAQDIENVFKKSKEIPIGTNVFVQLVFEANVQVVRNGAPDMVLINNEENVVTIQGLQDEIRSNISVKTADGLYYSYRIFSGEEDTIPLFYQIPMADAVNAQTKLVEDQKKQIVEKMSIQEVAQTIYSYEGYIKNRNRGSYKNISLSIKGLYIDKGKLFFLFIFANKSNINYKIEKIQFFTKPIKKSKRRIESEEKEYVPLFWHKPLKELKANTSEVAVAVFDQFTLNDQKKIEVIMTETEGERTVRLEINSEKITEAKKI